MNREAIIKLALNKAFQLGQRYWSWADSEYSSHWKKADAAKVEFEQLVQDTINVALAEQPAQQGITLDGMTANEFALAELYAFQEATGCDTADQLKAQQQEPVATLDDLEQEIYENTREFVSRNVMEWMLKRYYTPPASKPWAGLDQHDIDVLFLNEDGVRFARYIEAKLKEKNT